MKRALVLLLGIGLAVTSIGVAQDDTLTVERVWGGDEFAGGLSTLRWMADGTSYTYVAGSDTTDLYRVDARSGAAMRVGVAKGRGL